TTTTTTTTPTTTTTTTTTPTTTTTTTTTPTTTTTTTTTPTTTTTTTTTPTTTTTTTPTTTTTTTPTTTTTTTTTYICVDTRPPEVEVLPYEDYIKKIGSYTTIFDSHQGNLRVCINVVDDCGINSVSFGYKIDCDPWNYWSNYTFNNESKYCYDIPRELWTKYMDDTVNWGYRVVDISGKTSINYDVTFYDPIIVRDDDTEPPEFSEWNYRTVVSFNQTIPIRVKITDYSGIDSAKLYYDLNNDGIAEGSVNPSVSGDYYTFEIPRICESDDKEICTEQGKARIFLYFWIIAVDADNDRPNDKTDIRYNGMPIYIDPPDEDAPDLGDLFYIASYSPSESSVEILEGRAVNFYAYTNYPRDANLMYRWVLDGKQISTNNYQYSYQTDHTSSGKHTVTVYIDNGKQTISKTWNVNVVDKICDFEMQPQQKSSSSSKSSSSRINTYTTVSSPKPTETTVNVFTTTTQKDQYEITLDSYEKASSGEKTKTYTGFFAQIARYAAAIGISLLIIIAAVLFYFRFLSNKRSKEEVFRR
ncbi:MAG: hypothetical protein QXF88_01375, partial [Candidatus Aenigmatarchaeota archaeon]